MERFFRTSHLRSGPVEASAALVWFAAVPWLVVGLRAAIGDHDGVLVLASASGFVVTLPMWATGLLGFRPARWASVLAVIAAANAVPWAVMGWIATSWPAFDASVAAILIGAWVLSTACGAAFASLAYAGRWLSARARPAALVRASEWGDGSWWRAAVLTTAIAVAATPVLLVLGGVVLVPVIVGATLLDWTASMHAVTWRTLAWVIVSSLPVVVVGVLSEPLNTPAIVVLGVLAAVMLPFLASRGSAEDPRGPTGRPHDDAPAGAVAT